MRQGRARPPRPPAKKVYEASPYLRVLDEKSAEKKRILVFVVIGTQPSSGASTMASRCSPCLNVTLAAPSMVRSLSAGTFNGPGEGAVPGAGCGKAVERAVWNVTLPSTFCIT